MSILILLLFFGLFYGSLILGKWLSKKYSFIAKIGAKIYNNKVKQLETSSLFQPLRVAIQKKSILKAFLVIFPLILLKSIVFYFISILLITPLFLIIQGIAMGSLFNWHLQNNRNLKDLQTITFWQLTSHIIAASLGFKIGLNWLYFKQVDFNPLVFPNDSYLYFTLITLTALIAAYKESKSIVYKNPLDL